MVGLLFLYQPAFALPNLQLDIVDGSYDTVTETTVATTDPFTLVALLQDAAMLGDDFYLSMAVIPSQLQSTPGPELGQFSFTVDTTTTTVNVTSDMTYGTPPIEIYSGNPDGDLSPHGIFDTYFYEYGFNFDGNNTVDAYNTADSNDPDANGEILYSFEASVDTQLLEDGYEIHFDLYNKTANDKRSIVIDGFTYYDLDPTEFAPFSHDAESGDGDGGGGGGGDLPVPEPGTLVLLGCGLLSLAGVARRKS